MLCGAVRSQASSEGRRTLTLLGCRARRRLRHGREGRDNSPRASRRACPTSAGTCCDGRRRLPLQPLLQLPSLPGAWARSDSAACRPQRRCCAGGPRARWARSAAFPQLLRKHGFGGRRHRRICARYSDFAICSCGGILQICQWYRVCDAGALRAEPLATLLSCAVTRTSHATTVRV